MNTPTTPTTLPIPATPQRILVVDDNRAIHDDFRKILGSDSTGEDFDLDDADFFGSAAASPDRIHFDLDFASQGREALDKVIAAGIAGRPYSVVFMDVRMPPGWDGIETTARVWEADPDLQVVICTAYSDYSWEEMVARLGNTDRLLILKKPFDIIEVVQCAHALTAKWSLLQQTRRHAESLEAAVQERTSDLEIANVLLKSEIAERQRTEDALRFTQFSVDNSSDAMFWVAPNSGLLYVNVATCRILGYTVKELHAMSVLDIIPELRDGAWDPYWKGLSEERHRTTETYQLTRDGRRIPIELTAAFFSYGGQELLCVSTRDITARQQILSELSAARDAALESVRLKSQFLANMSHEIRTPMNGVIGMIELLNHTRLDSEQRDFLDTIHTSADLLLSIINDILDSSKIESGKLIFDTLDFDLGAVVDGTLDIVGGSARGKDVELAAIVRSEVSPRLRGDAGRLRQVLTNILGNAVKFTEQGEVILTVSQLSESPTHVQLRFEVRDTGIGIPEEVRRNIFDPFIQADSSDSRKYGGTGLGLTICRQIVEAIGGEIGVDSVVGKGSTFWFTLGFEKQTGPARLDPEIVDLPADLRILVVDDNATNREILHQQLVRLQMRPTTVESAAGALDILRRESIGTDPFRLAVIDMQMPGMDGLALARQIKTNPATAATRLILLSSLGEPLPDSTLADAGVEEFLMKPLKQARLQSALAGLLCRDPQPAPQAPQPPNNPTPLRILLAEDNCVNRKVALLQLRNLGYSADVATDGITTLQMMEDNLYDVILMDCQMPQMDGFAATREIRRRHSHPVRIIAMTASAMQGDKEKCLEAGMNYFLTKPVNPLELGKLLEKCKAVVPIQAAATEAPVDLDRLLEITANDPEMLSQLTHDYVEQAEEILGLMDLAILQQNSGEIHRLAHKLCGSSASCGMRAIVRPLEQIERLGQTLQFALARNLHQDALRQLTHIRSFLSHHLAGSSTLTHSIV